MDSRIVFVPAEAISFNSLISKQTAQLSIKNNWDRRIIFKMKTTRPRLFKMRPVYGMVEKGQEKVVRLIFKGFDNSEKPPCSRDRFTIVLAPAPTDCNDASRVWRQKKVPEVIQQTARKVLKIKYGDADQIKVVSAPDGAKSATVPIEPAKLPVTVPAKLEKKSGETDKKDKEEKKEEKPVTPKKEPEKKEAKGSKEKAKEDEDDSSSSSSEDES